MGINIMFVIFESNISLCDNNNNNNEFIEYPI